MVAPRPVRTLCECDSLEGGTVVAHLRLVQQLHDTVDGPVETNDVVFTTSAGLEFQPLADAVLVE